jgi:hypothetical protein
MQAKSLRGLHNNDAKKHQVDTRHTGKGSHLISTTLSNNGKQTGFLLGTHFKFTVGQNLVQNGALFCK